MDHPFEIRVHRGKLIISADLNNLFPWLLQPHPRKKGEKHVKTLPDHSHAGGDTASP